MPPLFLHKTSSYFCSFLSLHFLLSKSLPFPSKRWESLFTLLLPFDPALSSAFERIVLFRLLFFCFSKFISASFRTSFVLLSFLLEGCQGEFHTQKLEISIAPSLLPRGAPPSSPYLYRKLIYCLVLSMLHPGGYFFLRQVTLKRLQQAASRVIAFSS